MKKTLFSASGGTGTYYERVITEEPHLKDVASPVSDENLSEVINKLYVKWYLKTGLFCKMDYVTFLNQPYLAMKEITKEIDRRIEDHEDEILNYEHLALMLALSKLFG